MIYISSYFLNADADGGTGPPEEKGTDCGPTAVELWLSRAKIAKKEGLFSHYECA